MNRDNYTFLTTAPVHRVVNRMALPTIVSMMVTSLYNMADTYFVGKINTQCTAAVGVTFSVMAFIRVVGFFFGHGSDNFISRQLGTRHTCVPRRMAATGFFCSVAFGALIALAGHLFLTRVALLLGSTPTILPYTERYLGIVLLGAPMMTGALTLNNQMRFQGNAAYAMYGIVAGAALNVLLDPLFIFVFRMGIAGAACATLASQACSFVILLLMTRRGGTLRIHARCFSPTPALLREIVYGGTPSLSRQGLGAVSTVLLNVAAGAYGDAAIAGMSIVGRLSFFIYSVVIGMGQGFQPLCGFCYGAGLYRRVREGYAYCVRTGTVALTAVAVVLFVFAEPVVHEFRADAGVVAVGAAALRWQVLTYPLVAAIVLTNMLMQTIRKPLSANLVAAARSGLFFIPLIVILPHFFGLRGVEMCQAVADVCAFSLSVPVALHAFSVMQRQAAQRQP